MATTDTPAGTPTAGTHFTGRASVPTPPPAVVDDYLNPEPIPSPVDTLIGKVAGWVFVFICFNSLLALALWGLWTLLAPALAPALGR